MGVAVTEGLGAGSQPEIGRAAAEEVLDEIRDHLAGAHMVFVTAGMGGGTGTGAAPVIARAATRDGHPDRRRRDQAVPLRRRPPHARSPKPASPSCRKCVDTLIIIPNQNLFRVANEKTTFADAFAMADQVLYSGVACITDLMVKEGLINLDFADVRAVMREMGKAMMGTGEASGEKRAHPRRRSGDRQPAARRCVDEGRRGLLISITGGEDLGAVRGRRSRHPHPRGSGSGRQHHPRRHVRREPRGHHPRVGGGHRHRPLAGAGGDAAGSRRRRAASVSASCRARPASRLCRERLEARVLTGRLARRLEVARCAARGFAAAGCPRLPGRRYAGSQCAHQRDRVGA